MLRDVTTMVMAGGRGERLHPLTDHRAKPAVPFGGVYRILDFTLSNCLNSGLRRINVLTQYKSMSLHRHVTTGWDFFSRSLGEFIDVIPPQQRIGAVWYRGTADAIYQNIYTIELERPRVVLVLAGDHIYKMNYAEMIAFHRLTNAHATVAAVEVDVAEGSSFGILQVAADGRITGFQEKPPDPIAMPGDPSHCLASMGIYVFDYKVLIEALERDAAREDSSHDFGKDVLPTLLAEGGEIFAYNFRDENKKAAKYWRDVGTLDAYYEANMDLVAVTPSFNLYDPAWPIRTNPGMLPPPKFVFADRDVRMGVALDSLVSPGSIVSGGNVERSILGPRVRINSYARVESSIIFDEVNVGRRAWIRRAIIDKYVDIPSGARIGHDPEEDRKRGFTVTPSGLVVVPKRYKFKT